MTIEQIKNALPDYAKDIKLNLGTILSEEGAPDLNLRQIASVALASSYAARNPMIINAVTAHANSHLNTDEINAAKAAAAIMAMNNVYYRFTHSVSDQTYASMPARLRMNVMANPSTDKILFELNSLAVSAINGCSKCMDAHVIQLEKAGVSKQAIQSAVRIAAVINAASISHEIAE